MLIEGAVVGTFFFTIHHIDHPCFIGTGRGPVSTGRYAPATRDSRASRAAKGQPHPSSNSSRRLAFFRRKNAVQCGFASTEQRWHVRRFYSFPRARVRDVTQAGRNVRPRAGKVFSSIEERHVDGSRGRGCPPLSDLFDSIREPLRMNTQLALELAQAVLPARSQFRLGILEDTEYDQHAFDDPWHQFVPGMVSHDPEHLPSRGSRRPPLAIAAALCSSSCTLFRCLFTMASTSATRSITPSPMRSRTSSSAASGAVDRRTRAV